MRIVRRGSFASSASGAAASKPEKASTVYTDPASTPATPAWSLGVCEVPNTLIVLAEPAFTTNKTPRTTKTRISKTPRIVPSSADARTPKKPTRPMIAAPSRAHGHHRFAG